MAFLGGGKVSAYAATISTNSLPASVGMGSPASRQSSTLNGFTDIAPRFVAGVALADASRQRRHAGNLAAIFFLF